MRWYRAARNRAMSFARLKSTLTYFLIIGDPQAGQTIFVQGTPLRWQKERPQTGQTHTPAGPVPTRGSAFETLSFCLSGRVPFRSRDAIRIPSSFRFFTNFQRGPRPRPPHAPHPRGQPGLGPRPFGQPGMVMRGLGSFPARKASITSPVFPDIHGKTRIPFLATSQASSQEIPPQRRVSTFSSRSCPALSIRSPSDQSTQNRSGCPSSPRSMMTSLRQKSNTGDTRPLNSGTASLMFPLKAKYLPTPRPWMLKFLTA